MSSSVVTRASIVFALSGALLSAQGCGDDGGEVVVPETYAFESRFEPGVSSVSYSGQTMRQVLIHDLNFFIASLDSLIDGGRFDMAGQGDVVAALDEYFRFDSTTTGTREIPLTTDPPTLQTTFDDISSDKDLVGKLAGNDAVTDHRDWSMEFGGWADADIAAAGGNVGTPEGLVVAYFETLEELVLAQVASGARMDSEGNPIPVYVTDDGRDLKQLIQKFLLGAVTYSQGTDDYLDDDVDGKGLLADHVDPDDGDPYTALEHAWDEGFGYFGAARDYGAYTDEEIAGAGGRPGWSDGYHDSDQDGAIDLKSEYNFGNSTNAAKRDRGAQVPTDFTQQAWDAFRRGRAIIDAAGGALGDSELADLQAERDRAVDAWERAIAATVVHNINDTLQAMNAFGDAASYDFADHAKVWSEMKGFALGLQFNPRSSLSDTDFATFHDLVGDAPVLADADPTAIDQYRADLLAARDLLQAAYGFDEANIGADDGTGGW